jgi:hypothetical protein
MTAIGSAKEVAAIADCLQIIAVLAQDLPSGTDKPAKVARLVLLAEHIATALREVLSVPAQAVVPTPKPAPRAARSRTRRRTNR